MSGERTTLILGDCLEKASIIEDGSVDLILTDPPYGTMKGFGDGLTRTPGRYNSCLWDNSIDVSELFKIASRILREQGTMILFSQEPYTGLLTRSVRSNISFRYRMIWEKDHFSNALLCNTAPVSYFEDICVFKKEHDDLMAHPLRSYFKNVLLFSGKSRGAVLKELGQSFNHVFRVESTQFSLCTKSSYDKIVSLFNLRRMDGFVEFEELSKIDATFNATFNLWEGRKVKSNILKYKKDYGGHHPTQKPVLLLEDLIKTFSNKDDMVVDLTMGSGSTGVACANTGRIFVGIEKDDKFFATAQSRIKQAVLTASEGQLSLEGVDGETT